VASNGGGLQRDLVSEPLELRDEAAGGALWVAAAVVVAAEFAVRGGSNWTAHVGHCRCTASAVRGSEGGWYGNSDVEAGRQELRETR
jgi:hypothetical protein